MIRFACPSCNSVFTVPDEKGGKTGKCPKCEAQFVIPEAETGAAPAAPPPPPSEPPPMPASSDIEIEPCPGCQAKLTVEAGDLGKDVECPYCKTTYTAKDPNAKPKKSLSKRPRDEEDEDDRPVRKKKDRFGEDRDDDRRYDDDDDDIDDNRPRRRKKSRRGSSKSGAVTTVAILNFVLGGLGLLCACGMFGLGAMIRELFQRAAAQGKQMPLDPDMMMVLFMVLGVVYLILAMLMIVGGVGLQQRKSYGRYITFATSTLSILLALFSCISLVGNIIAGQGSGICGALFGIIIWGGYGVFALITMINSGREFD